MAGNPNIREINKATRFKPGQSGNPTGRRPGLSLTRLVRDELQKDDGTGKTKGEVVAEKVVEMAMAGNTVFAPLVWRYVDGDPKAASSEALRELAEKLAPKLGLNADDLLSEFLKDLGAA